MPGHSGQYSAGAAASALASVPASFVVQTLQRSGAAGEAWLRTLPDVATRLLADWDLTALGPVAHGYLGLVLRVGGGGRDYALKLSEPSSAEFVNQVASLTAWAGRAMIEAERYSLQDGAILMPWLDHSASLDTLDLDTAVGEAGTLLRRLSVPASASSGLPRIGDVTVGWPTRWRREWERLGRPLPPSFIQAASECVFDLASNAQSVLVDHDLHYRNILRSPTGDWVAVDPKGVIGDPEFALGPLMWNRFTGPQTIARRFDELVDRADLDRDRARRWLLVSVVDYFLWSVGIGLTDDPHACRLIADWLRTGGS